LVLSNTNPGTGLFLGGDLSLDTYRALVLSDWRMASLALTERALGNSFDASSQQWRVRTWEEGVTAEMAAQLLTAFWNIDVRDLLPKVSVPTLVVHYRNNRLMAFEAGRKVAAGIQGARFVPLPGDAHYFYFGDTKPLLRAIAEFLGDPIEEDRQPDLDSPKSQFTPEAQAGIFRREGEFWSISPWGEVFRLKDVRGLAHIAYLLGHPKQEFHVLSLASTTEGKESGTEASGEPSNEDQTANADLTVGRMGDAGEMLDPQAKAAYKRRIAELREQLEDVRQRNRSEVVDRIEDEIETLGQELSRAVGLGGRDRRAASASERARINVTRAIKIALERIAEHSALFATILAKSIRTGTFCSYTPDSRLPASWQL
jgi:hypothetical protein